MQQIIARIFPKKSDIRTILIFCAQKHGKPGYNPVSQKHLSENIHKKFIWKPAMFSDFPALLHHSPS